MAKISFIGAGSTVFAKNIIGDIPLENGLHDVEIALYDIDAGRLDDSLRLIRTLNGGINAGRARVCGYVGSENRRAAPCGADFVINAIQVGGYVPSTVLDFGIPKKYGLRTIPQMWEIGTDMAAVCTGAMLRETPVKTVGCVTRFSAVPRSFWKRLISRPRIPAGVVSRSKNGPTCATCCLRVRQSGTSAPLSTLPISSGG